MKTIAPIGIETQIEDVLLGQSKVDKDRVQEKIKFVSANVHNIKKINGSNVYDVVIKDDSLWYNLRKTPDSIKTMFKDKFENGDGRYYYYPIQYANITFKEN